MASTSKPGLAGVEGGVSDDLAPAEVFRTEESYLVWVERFAAYLGTSDLRSQAPPALNEQLSASSQRQALNALVFLFRDVFQMLDR